MLKFKIPGSVYCQDCLVVVNDPLSTGVYIGVNFDVHQQSNLNLHVCPGNLNNFMLIIFEINRVKTATINI